MGIGIWIAEKYEIPLKRINKLYDNYGVLHEMNNTPDSAFFYYNKALLMKNQIKDSIGIPYTLNKIAFLSAQLGNFHQAYKYLDLSDKYREKETGEFGRIENFSLREDILALEGKTDQAIQMYIKTKNNAQLINYPFLVMYSLEQLKNLYNPQKDYINAYNTLLELTRLKDSLDNAEVRSHIAELEIAFETSRKDQLIYKSQQKIKAQEQQLIFSFIITILLILLFIGIYRYQHLKRKNDLIKVEFNSKLAITEMEKSLSEEKLQISRELHDNIGSQLTFIITSIENLIHQNSNPSEVAEKLNSVKNFAKDTLTDVRNTLWAMKHSKGDLNDLVIKVNELVSKLNGTLDNLQFELYSNVDSATPLTSTQMLNLYRIIQEAIQNSIKHSQANKIKIKLLKQEYGFNLEIEDNGKGFDVFNETDGLGLSTMKKRCLDSNGEFSIESHNNGTKITCKIKL